MKAIFLNYKMFVSLLYICEDQWLLDRVRFSTHLLKSVIFVSFCNNTDSTTWQQFVILWRLHCDLSV